MRSKNVSKAWEQYEAGKEYKRRIGLYETVRANERFYRGDQWYGVSSDNALPRPVFNIIRRIVDFLVCSVASSDISIRYSAENTPFLEKKSDGVLLRSHLDAINKSVAYRWEKDCMDRKIYSALTDAAISGDGIFYCYWDQSKKGAQEFTGDITTEVVDNVNLFVADVNVSDIQSQEYVILAGRKSVSALRNEARAHGVSEDDIKKIVPDSGENSQSGALSELELKCPGDEKATYIIKFQKDEKGKVFFEKSTRECIICRAATDCTLYPVAYFNWYPTKNSFHGNAPVSSLVPNQKYINRAYAMVMKHMSDTAFSKVIYDKSRIPEWSNEVGEAIGAMGGGNIADAVSVVGVGKLQDHYLDLIQSTVDVTKDLMGATESALGAEQANNTSAILALQETSRVPLRQIRSSLHKCLEDLANIWADMMCAYYPAERLLVTKEGEELEAISVDLSFLRKAALCARVDLCETSRLNASSSQTILDKLLTSNHISASEYISRLPSGLIPEREELLARVREREQEGETSQ